MALFISVHFDATGTRNTFQRIWKYMKSDFFIQNFERRRMHSLYSVMSCNCCMITKKHKKNHINIFRIEWDRNIIITVISDHLSYAKGRCLVYISFTNLNVNKMAVWLLQQHNIMLAEQCTSAWNLSNLSFLDTENYAYEKTTKQLICANDLIQHGHPKYSTFNELIIVWLFEPFVAF